MKKIVTYVVVGVVIALVVVSGKKAVEHKKAEDAKTPKAVQYAMNVKAINPVKMNNSLTLPYLALTKSNDDVKISSRVNARINYIVKSGKSVKKGDVLVKIDDKDLKTQFKALNLNISSLKSQLKSKKIALQNLISTHKRTEKLFSVKGASKEQYDKEETNIEATKAGLDTLKFKIKELEANKDSVKNMLSYTTIKAPIDGVVTRLTNVGDIAMMGKPLLSVSASSNSYLVVRLPSDVKSSSIIFQKKKYEIIPLNTTFNGLLEYLANIDESLASNQLVNIDVVVYDGVSFKIPHDGVLNKDGKSFVLVVKGAKAYPKEVHVVANGEQGVVVDNINADEKIVVAKPDILLKLVTGTAIQVIK